MRKNEKVEKSKYWRRNDGFSFLPKVKVTHLIDSPIVFFAGISLAGEWMNNPECYLLASQRSVLLWLFCHFLFMAKFKIAQKVKGERGNSMNNDTTEEY